MACSAFCRSPTPSSAARTSRATASRTPRRRTPAAPSQSRAIGTSGAGWNSAAVPRTPAIMTGIVIGYNRTGSSTSRLRARTSMAANSVPTAAKPSVPQASRAASSSGLVEDRRPEEQGDQRHQQSSTSASSSQDARAACRRRWPGRSAGASISARSVSPCARARTCGPAPACRRTQSQSTGCRPPHRQRPAFLHEREGEDQDARHGEEQRRRRGSRGSAPRR